MQKRKNDFCEFQTGKEKRMKKMKLKKCKKFFCEFRAILIEIRNSSQIAFCGFFDLFRRSKMDSYLKGDKT